ncbi:MAG: cycloartenol synthase [Pedosphaera sp.]|nr:cycloartenol synthase [Pedosphaera sp.]
MNPPLPSSPRLAQILCLLLGCCLLAGHARGADAPQIVSPPPLIDLSFGHEIQNAIDRGLASLLASQNTNGWWSTQDHVAPTALVLTAFMGEPTRRFRTNPPAALTKGYGFILGAVKPDGSIYRTSLINYNTSLSMLAMAASDNPAHDGILRRARAFVVRSQMDLDEPGKMDSPYDGGIGYGDKYAHSDMNNTLTALEALHYTRHLQSGELTGPKQDVNWKAVVQFLQNCQNLPSHNRQPWASDDARNRGGFVYYPGHSMAGGETNALTGRVALRSYGSISYAGLLSYIYADLPRDDPRVVAVLDWLRSNYTLEENPGMDLQGLYYYLHLMTKALNTARVQTLELKDGRKINWRREVALRLINLQRPDGTWANTNARWWEKDPNLVTAYAVLSLDILHRGIQ